MTNNRQEPMWVKSSYSGTQANCVELAVTASSVLVRDSKDPAGGSLDTSYAALRGLVAALAR
jgi:hypothetical protein